MKKIISLLMISLSTIVLADELDNNTQNMQQNSSGVKFVITNNSGQTLYNFRVRSAIYNQWVELGKIFPGENTIEVGTALNEKTVGTFEFETVDSSNEGVYMLGGYSYNSNHSVNITLGKDLKYNLQVQHRDENNKVLKYTNSNAELSTIKDSVKDISMYMGCQGIGVIYGHVWCQGTDVDYDGWGWGAYAFAYIAGEFSSPYNISTLINYQDQITATGSNKYPCFFTTEFKLDTQGLNVAEFISYACATVGGGTFSVKGGHFSNH